jgi:hypothetical protein
MKKFTIHLLLLASCTAQLLMAQQSGQTIDRFAGTNFVSGDDDEQIQIVPVGLAAAGPKKYHGGPVLKSVQQVPIFLGKGWAENEARARQTALADLLVSDNVVSGELQSHAIKTLRAAPSVDDFSDLSAATVNDLVIQRKLVDLLHNKAIPAPGANTVYVVYLASGISSSVGASKAGKDYLAYHNVLNAEVGEVRYVVVAYNQDVATQRAAAARAYSEAAVNPRGFDGWF